MVRPNSTSKTVTLSEFSLERDALYNIVSTRILNSHFTDVNFKIHKNYKLDANEIKDRLDAITNKFRKCEMIYHLYFDGLDHNILASTSTDFPIMRHGTFESRDGILKRYFEADSRNVYQELIDYSFQEIILFTSSVLENLVYLSETLIKKVSIHTSKNNPQSITMSNFIELLDFLHRLNYRNPSDPVASCLRMHGDFLTRYLPTINVLRNKYIHGFSRNLKSMGGEYVLTGTQEPLLAGSTDVIVNEFTKKIVENLKLLIPQFFSAITDTITAKIELPA